MMKISKSFFWKILSQRNLYRVFSHWNVMMRLIYFFFWYQNHKNPWKLKLFHPLLFQFCNRILKPEISPTMETQVIRSLEFSWPLLVIWIHSNNICLSTGPQEWASEYSSCKGKHQSPIDIDVLHLKKVKLPPLKLENFNTEPNATHIENNGHTGNHLAD